MLILPSAFVFVITKMRFISLIYNFLYAILLKTYVLTHRNEADATGNIRFRNMDACQLVEELR